MCVFGDESSESSSNLGQTTTNEDPTITTPTNDAISSAEAYYNRNGYSKAVLLAMAIGSKEDQVGCRSSPARQGTLVQDPEERHQAQK